MQGDELSEEEVVNGVAELILHPKYTIPLIGCFRPIAKRILDRTIGLLKLVPDLKSNVNDPMIELNEDELLRDEEGYDNSQIVSMIELYVRSGKGLSLHELACWAFSRAIDLVPTLLG